MKKYGFLLVLFFSSVVFGANYNFYVGGRGDQSDANDLNGGGAIDTVAYASAMGVNGGALYEITVADYTTADKTITKAGEFATGLEGIFCYVSGTDLTTGIYEIASSTANTLVFYIDIGAGSDSGASDVVANVGGAFSTIGTDSAGAMLLCPDADAPTTTLGRELYHLEVIDCNYASTGHVLTTTGGEFADISAGDMVLLDGTGVDNDLWKVNSKVDTNNITFGSLVATDGATDITLRAECQNTVTLWVNKDFTLTSPNYIIFARTGAIEFNQWFRLKGYSITPGDMDKGGSSYGSRVDLDGNSIAERYVIAIKDAGSTGRGNFTIENFYIHNLDQTTYHDTDKYRIGIQGYAGDRPYEAIIRNCKFEDLHWGISNNYNLLAAAGRSWRGLIIDNCTFIDCRTKAPISPATGGAIYLHLGSSPAGMGSLVINCSIDDCHNGIIAQHNSTVIGTTAANCDESGFETLGTGNIFIQCNAYNNTVGFRPNVGAAIMNLINCVSFGNTYGLRVGTVTDALGRNRGSYALTEYNCVVSNSAYDYASCLGVSPTWDSTNAKFENDITNDPQFIDAANDDFRLNSNSPCINTGKPTLNDGKTSIGAWQPNAIAEIGHRSRYDFEDIYSD